MVAIDTGNIECIQELIICGAKLDLADAQGNNVFHYAAKCSNSTAIQVHYDYYEDANNRIIYYTHIIIASNFPFYLHRFM